ncbi:MAG TPA: hypothetical protein VMF50_08665 [Candidatus Binataceae bacterium]|nr:hypothetical protein [Candidatus Binataceae bacterium]
MAESIAEIETEAGEARRELGETLAAISGKAAATGDKLYAPALSIAVALAAGLGFMIGSRRGHRLTPLVFAAAGYCGLKLVRRRGREP